MRKRLAAVATLTLLLGACAWPQHERMRNARPVVDVSGDTVKSVSPDPLRFRPDQGAVVIHWRLSGSEYSFPGNGIVIDGELDRPGGKIISRDQKEITDCRPLDQGRQFQCTYRNSRPGTFKYSVRVLRQGKALAPLDPEITNLS